MHNSTSSYDGRRLARRLFQDRGGETASRPPFAPPVVRQCHERRRCRHASSDHSWRPVSSQRRPWSVPAPPGPGEWLSPGRPANDRRPDPCEQLSPLVSGRLHRLVV